MGNIMYICASGFTREEWGWKALLMLIFWIYRMISCYLYLILITIFASVKFNTSGDILAHYNDRYDQTFIDKAGLAAFIYCWIATPIWQCALCCLDFQQVCGMKGETVRIVDDLCAAKQYDDAMQLLCFGAEFDGDIRFNAERLHDVMDWILSKAPNIQRKYIYWNNKI